MVTIEDCLFCKIVNEEVPSAKIYKDGDVIAFLDIFPISKGHTIVVPREHNSTFIDFPDDRIERFFTVLKQLTINIKNKLNADGINILQNNFSAAGQIIYHMHFHIIPRWIDDGAVKLRQSRVQVPPEELQEVLQQIVG